MSITRFAATTFAVGVMVLGASMVSGQNYPNKPIRIVTGSPGGGADTAARYIAQAMSANIGQPVIVDNRAILGPENTAKAQPDGYTVLLDGESFWVTPLLQPTTYDVMRDFSPVTSTTSLPNIVLVHPSLAVSSVKELIALAKAKPGALNYASSGVGGSVHLVTELFKSMAGVDIVHVPYKGQAAGLVGLLAGEVQLMIASAGPATPHLRAGKLRALAVTQPTAQFPGIPTVAAAGVPGYEAGAMTGVFAPARTPPAVVNRLSQEIVRALRQADVKQQLLNFGLEPTGSSPEEFAETVKFQMAKWSKLIKEAGIKAN